MVRVLDTVTAQSFVIEAGEYQFNAIGGDGDETISFVISPPRLTVSRGEKKIVTVTTVIKPTSTDSQPRLETIEAKIMALQADYLALESKYGPGHPALSSTRGKLELAIQKRDAANLQHDLKKQQKPDKPTGTALSADSGTEPVDRVEQLRARLRARLDDIEHELGSQQSEWAAVAITEGPESSKANVAGRECERTGEDRNRD